MVDYFDHLDLLMTMISLTQIYNHYNNQMKGLTNQLYYPLYNVWICHIGFISFQMVLESTSENLK